MLAPMLLLPWVYLIGSHRRAITATILLQDMRIHTQDRSLRQYIGGHDHRHPARPNTEVEAPYNRTCARERYARARTHPHARTPIHGVVCVCVCVQLCVCGRVCVCVCVCV